MRGLTMSVLAALAVTGCGAHPVEEGPSLDQVAAAIRADPYHFEGSLETEGLADPFTGTATGAADPSARHGVIRYRFDDGGDEFTLEVRRIADETYTLFSAKDYEGGWIRESTAEADELIGPFGAFSEPHRAVDALAQFGRDVKSEPGEPVGGEPTTHFRATVPTVELLGGGATKARREELEAEIRKTRSESAEVEAWAGADGLLRRLQFSIPITEDGDRGRLLSSTRFYDFGKPVEVETPATSELDPVFQDPGSGRPCRAAAAPHSPEAVMEAFRRAGFILTTFCFDDETTILAVPKKYAGDDDGGIVCSVRPEPRSAEEPRYNVVAGNVACEAKTSAEIKTVRTLLAGL